MQNGRESQYCEFLEFLGRPMNFLGRPTNFLGRGSSWVATHQHAISTGCMQGRTRCYTRRQQGCARVLQCRSRCGKRTGEAEQPEGLQRIEPHGAEPG
eukprot:COSAG02_NODE_3991_length_5942_cov_5.521308_2_plen_98_part_00